MRRVISDPDFQSDRYFRFWEYRVSHRSLLIRSVVNPGAGGPETNLDLIMTTVGYIDAPMDFSGIALGTPTEEEIQRLLLILKPTREILEIFKVWVLLSAGSRALIVANSLQIEENDDGQFASPFDWPRPPG